MKKKISIWADERILIFGSLLFSAIAVYVCYSQPEMWKKFILSLFIALVFVLAQKIFMKKKINDYVIFFNPNIDKKDKKFDRSIQWIPTAAILLLISLMHLLQLPLFIAYCILSIVLVPEYKKIKKRVLES